MTTAARAFAHWTETVQSAVLILMLSALPLGAMSFVAHSL